MSEHARAQEGLTVRSERGASRHREANPHLDTGMSGGALSEVASKVALLRPLSVRLVSILLARAIERGGGSVTDASKPAEPKARSRKTKRPPGHPGRDTADGGGNSGSVKLV